MAIKLQCDCGRALRLKDHLGGKRIRCPDCNTVLAVPEAVGADVEEPQEVEPADSDDRSPSRSGIVPGPSDQYTPRFESAPARSEPDPSRPRKRKKRRHDGDSGRDRGGGVSISPGVITGVLMIVGAIVWFIVGLWAGWVFFYPPILLVLGIIRLVTALMGSED